MRAPGKYRTRAVVDAFELRGIELITEPPEKFPEWIRKALKDGELFPCMGFNGFGGYGLRQRDRRPDHAFPGDWVIRDASGALSLCKAAVFASTYEPVEAAS